MGEIDKNKLATSELVHSFYLMIITQMGLVELFLSVKELIANRKQKVEETPVVEETVIKEEQISILAEKIEASVVS